MPKILPENEKRVPLNCLIAPATREAIERVRGNLSQGEIVDAGIAALNTPLIEISQKLAKKSETNNRSFKGPLLKPSERK